MPKATLPWSRQERGGAEKGGDSDEDAGQCKGDGKMCMSNDKCCSGSCVGGGGSLVTGNVLGRCAGGAALAQSDQDRAAREGALSLG